MEIKTVEEFEAFLATTKWAESMKEYHRGLFAESNGIWLTKKSFYYS